MNLEEAALIKIMEECAEIQQLCSKALRFGLNEVKKDQEKTNFERLNDEINDLETAYKNFEEVTGLRFTSLSNTEYLRRRDRIIYYNNYSKKLGKIT